MKKETNFICVLALYDKDIDETQVLLLGVFKNRNKGDIEYDLFLQQQIELYIEEELSLDDIEDYITFEKYVFQD